jgi:hypothetical protein
MKIAEDILFIIALVIIPDCLLEQLGIYESMLAIINERGKA